MSNNSNRNTGNKSIWEEEVKEWVFENIYKKINLKSIVEESRKLTMSILNKLKNDEAIKYFQIALTHITYPITDDEINEQIESFGDLIVNELTGKLIINTYPNSSPSDINRMKGYYASNDFLSELIKPLKAETLVRKAEGVDVNIFNMGDIAEALFGALYRAVESQFPGLGYSFCWNWMVYLYTSNNIYIEPNKVGPNNVISVVKEIFDKIVLIDNEDKDLNISVKQSKGRTIATAYLGRNTTSAIRSVKEHNNILITPDGDIEIEDNMKFVRTGDDAKEAKRNLYTLLYDILKLNKIDLKTADEIKRKQIMSSISEVDKINFENKIKEDGYIGYDFYKLQKASNKTNKYDYIILKGIIEKDDNNLSETLYTVKGFKNNPVSSRKKLIELYLTNSKDRYFDITINNNNFD